jgi:ligand-binding SRPBCC domain-containing protein
MAFIKLSTKIKAPAETCFDLARSIDLHTQSMQHTKEQAVGGTTSGLIGLNETVTWRAKHFGITMEMTSRITELMYATSFTDEQVKGPFKKLKHLHTFQQADDGTLMCDYFEFESPMGFIGKLTDGLLLRDYLRRLLIERNKVIKQAAERLQESGESATPSHREGFHQAE